MDNQRSPRYPAVSLADAIIAAQLLWNKERRTAVAGDVLAKALGYSSYSGPVRTKVASMRQYGILEKYGNGLRLSDLGMRLVHNPANSEQFQQAVRIAALSPDLFSDLHKSHPDGSEDAIKSYLILEKGFSESGARLAATAYKDTLSLAGLNGAGYTADESEGQEMPEPQANPTTAKAPLSIAPGLRQDVFSLSEGPVTIQWPATISAESFQDLGDWLDILKSKIGRSVVKEDAH